MKSKIRFTQVATQGLPKGFPVVLCEPSSAHLQARAMVGEPTEVLMYAHPMGILKENIGANTIMFKSGELDMIHPDHPELIGPYGLNQNHWSIDYDSTNFDIRVAFNKEYPLAVANLCVDPKYKDSEYRNKETDIISVMVELPRWLAKNTHENAYSLVYDICEKMFPNAALEILTMESNW